MSPTDTAQLCQQQHQKHRYRHQNLQQTQATVNTTALAEAVAEAGTRGLLLCPSRGSDAFPCSVVCFSSESSRKRARSNSICRSTLLSVHSRALRRSYSFRPADSYCSIDKTSSKRRCCPRNHKGFCGNGTHWGSRNSPLRYQCHDDEDFRTHRPLNQRNWPPIISPQKQLNGQKRRCVSSRSRSTLQAFYSSRVFLPANDEHLKRTKCRPTANANAPSAIADPAMLIITKQG
ncbi:hypothetical protein cyc_06558 [Cyclospora cayetanensis]|uniref:Uncharacterized protein n=1 Tax=Cyclospora cayetanensis TaxID=88456 RepID=A0A1D3D3E8_9EIME|nr:hypothetical protein cyc_06558 [Cyclospora cayetanensis]